MYLTLPEADIGGLHFNKQKVRAVFEKKAYGWRHSRDILFLSARNVKDDNSRDILTEYLESDAVKDCFITTLKSADIGGYARDDIEISLPIRNEGRKRYNGVACWNWRKDRRSRTISSFRNVYGSGIAHYYYATSVGGCALRFLIKGADV
jgi:hypothetical protein